jgi:DNA helicase-2/ATP-dependent DNA helicase PcrA
MRYGLASRFLEEIPEGLVRSLSIRTARPQVAAREPVALYHPRPPSQREASLPYKVGSRVSHPKYGEGVVAGYQGQRAETEIKVNFPKVGEKWFILDYARLTQV